MKTGLRILFVYMIIFLSSMQGSSRFQKQNYYSIKIDSLAIVAESQILWTGVAVSKTNRIFANYPRWNKSVKGQVIEITKDGNKVDYPNSSWNDWEPGKPIDAKKFIAVQSVYTDDKDFLWVLDSGNPLLKGVQPGAAKLVKIDLSKNSVTAVYYFDSGSIETASYLNDVRVDTKRNYAYITDSGVGAIFVVDLAKSKIKKVLRNHFSTKAENLTIVVDGISLPGLEIHADAIAYDNINDYLYYKALTGHKLYKIKGEYLRNFNLPLEEVDKKVEFVKEVGVCDGIEFHPNGCLFISSIEDNSIKVLKPDGLLTVVLKNKLIRWPDSFSITTDGKVYFTVSQLHDQNSNIPYRILKLDY